MVGGTHGDETGIGGHKLRCRRRVARHAQEGSDQLCHRDVALFWFGRSHRYDAEAASGQAPVW